MYKSTADIIANIEVSSEESKGKSLEKKDDSFSQKEKWRIIKNVCGVGFASMMNFTAVYGTAYLQSSINADEGLGTASLAILNASLLFSNLFLAVIMIRWLGCKWTIAVSFLASMPYLAAQIKPSFGTFIPTALLMGLGAGPLLIANSTYITVISSAYAKVTKTENYEAAVAQLFGLFFMFCQLALILGNVISSAVLSSGDVHNVTVDPELLAMCGANFFPGNATAAGNVNLETPSKEKIYAMAGIYLACIAMAFIVVAAGVDSLDRYESDRKGNADPYGLKLIVTTIKLMKAPKQILMVPISMLMGMIQSVIGAEFTAAYVSCAWGIGNIGKVLSFYGVSTAFSSIVLGWLVKITGRIPLMSSAAVLQTGTAIGLLLWKPNPEQKLMYFIISGLWGLADGVWIVQINAFVGILFPGKEEAAYGGMRTWEALGAIISFAYAPYLRTDVKLYIYISTMWVGILGYLITEICFKRSKIENTKL